MASYFRVINKLVGQEISRYFDEELQKILESRLSKSDNFIQDETLRGKDLVIALINTLKLRPLGQGKKQKISFVVGSSDLLPFEFLERGIRCGKAVCQLKQKFSAQSIEPVIEVIKQRRYSKSDLNDIFRTDFSEVFLKDQDTQVELEPFKALENENIKQRFIQQATARPIPVASGFLVGKDYLLTNYHVLFDIQKLEDLSEDVIQLILNEFTADFRSGHAVSEGDRYPVPYLPEYLVHANQALDYALIRLKRLEEDELKNTVNLGRSFKLTFTEAGNNFGWIKLQKNAEVCPLITRNLLKEITEQLSDSDEGEKQLKANLRELETWDFPGEPVNIIQHPQGRDKEITVFNNRVQKLYKNFLQYEADADLGSSGSPVFNAQWQLVAIHHAALVTEFQGYDFLFNPILNVFRWFLSLPRIKTPLINPPLFQVAGQLGIRVSQVWADLNEKRSNSQCSDQEKINIFWNETMYPRRRRVFLLAGRDRSSILGKDAAEEETKLMKLLKEEIQAKLQSSKDLEVIPVPLPDIPQGSPMTEAERNACAKILDTNLNPQVVEQQIQECRVYTKVIQWINDPAIYAYEVGDVALELVLDHYPEASEARGAKTYYVRSSEERRIHAELLTSSLTSAVPASLPDQPGLPNRGAISDSAVSSRGLRFCREVLMPSLVLYVGFLTNEQDKALLRNEVSRGQAAAGIAKGLEVWVDSLSPNFDPDRYIQRR